nr:hypothetical protein [Tanacetum cinerariifolium]
MHVAEVLESFLERSDEWVVANKIEIKALNKIDVVKRGKSKSFNVDAFREYTPPSEEGIQRRNSSAADV